MTTGMMCLGRAQQRAMLLHMRDVLAACRMSARDMRRRTSHGILLFRVREGCEAWNRHVTQHAVKRCQKRCENYKFTSH